MTRTLKQTAGAALLALTLAGCTAPGGDSSFAEGYEDVYEMMATGAAQMPTTGTANYTGKAGLDVMDEDIGDLTGDFSMTADFSSGTASGQIANLSGETGRYDGTVALRSAAIENNTFTTELSGEISRYSTEKEYPVGVVFGGDSRAYGEFRGDSAEAVTGTFGGQGIHFEGDGSEMPRFEAPAGIKGGFVGQQ